MPTLRPPVPAEAIPDNIDQFQPEQVFQLDYDIFVTNLKESRK